MWSLRSSDNTRAVLTQNQTEAQEMVSSGAWTERCNPIAGPTVFCVNTVSYLWHVAEVFTNFCKVPADPMEILNWVSFQLGTARCARRSVHALLCTCGGTADDNCVCRLVSTRFVDNYVVFLHHANVNRTLQYNHFIAAAPTTLDEM